MQHLKHFGSADVFGGQLAYVIKRIQLQLSQPAFTPFIRPCRAVSITVFRCECFELQLLGFTCTLGFPLSGALYVASG
ncbi:hypothetical protein D3C87_1754480 [compost metagenome]